MEQVMFWGTKPSEVIKTLLGTESEDQDRLDSREPHVSRKRDLISAPMDGWVQPPGLIEDKVLISTEKCQTSWHLETPSSAAAVGPPGQRGQGQRTAMLVFPATFSPRYSLKR